MSFYKTKKLLFAQVLNIVLQQLLSNINNKKFENLIEKLYFGRRQVLQPNASKFFSTLWCNNIVKINQLPVFDQLVRKLANFEF